MRDFFTSLFSEDREQDNRRDIFDLPSLSDLLPYRVYDDETGLYWNEGSVGFILEMMPSTGGEEFSEAVLNVIQTALPQSAGIQVINWSSPRVDDPIVRWAGKRRMGGALVEEATSRRIKHLSGRAFGTDNAIKAIPHDRRVFVTAWIEGEASLSALTELKDFRKGLLAALGVEQDINVQPDGLLKFLSEVFHADQRDQAYSSYSTDMSIHSQVAGSTLEVGRNALLLDGTEKVSAVCMNVRRFPKEWAASLCLFLNGDPQRIEDRPHGPVLTTLTACSISNQKSQSEMLTKIAKMEHATKTGFAKFTMNFGDKQKEHLTLSDELERGERLFQTMMSVVTFVEGGEENGQSASSEMRKIYRRMGLNLANEKFLQLPTFLMALPLGANSDQMGSFKKMQRMRLLKGAAVAALAPVYGEWKGLGDGNGVLLLGRQGQVFNWSNFNSSGNYNAAIVGKSGAGKSVFMQELVFSIFANGGRVLVIDDGYSFKTTCDIVGGSHISFGGSKRIGLNPFSMLEADKMDTDEYAAEATELLTNIVSTMANLGQQREGRVEGVEEAAIASAVKDVWKEFGPTGEITNVYEKLLVVAQSDPRFLDVCSRIKSFTRGEIYGAYFEGEATVKIDAPFTVVELSDVKTQPALEQVILQIVMFLGTELMFKTDRSTQVAIVMDEAWDLLKGHGTERFIESVARRARKYTGALITGTQSLEDYYENPAALACLTNSDWTVMLAQKEDTIKRLIKADRLPGDAGLAQQLESITSVPGQFSEMAIKGPEGWIFGRLLLDQFSLAMFSSKGSTVQRLQELRDSGLDVVQALRKICDQGEAV